MFNFPHNGKGIKDVDRNIRNHQRLMLLFFENCQQLFDVINTDTISGYNTFNSNNNNNNMPVVHHQQGKSLFLCLKVNRIILGV